MVGILGRVEREWGVFGKSRASRGLELRADGGRQEK